MAYGELKVDTITFTNGGTDTSVAVSGLVLNPTFSGDITSTGTISGDIILGGTTVSGATVSGGDGIFVSGVFTDQISGATITGDTVKATSITGVNIIGTTSVSGATVTGTTFKATTITGGTIVGTTTLSGATITGNTVKATSITGVNIIGTTSVSGATITGGTIVGTTTISGVTVTGTTFKATTITGGTVVGTTTISGATVTGTAGNFTNITGGASTFTSNVTLNAQSDLRFADSDSSNWVAFQAPATVGSNVTWTLPATDATTSGYALVSDAAGNLSWASAGGGGLTYFTEAESTSAPNDVINTNSFTPTSSGTNADAALIPKGSGALLGQVPDSAVTGGNKRGTYSTDWQRSRFSADEVASGGYSSIIGGKSNKASGSYSSCLGGLNNDATGVYSAVGGENCTSTASHSFAYGYSVDATSSRCASVGGFAAGASGSDSGRFAGYNNGCSGAYSVNLGGYSGFADGQASVVLGGSYGDTRGTTGKVVIPASYRAIQSALGKTQYALLVLGRETTDATPTVLASTNSTPGTTNQLLLDNNTAYYFKGSVIAGVTGAGDTKAWTFEGAIKRGASAATTAIVGSVVLNTIAYDAGAAAWDVAITANTTNGCLKVEVTGAAATTIRWVAHIESTEMGY